LKGGQIDYERNLKVGTVTFPEVPICDLGRAHIKRSKGITNLMAWSNLAMHFVFSTNRYMSLMMHRFIEEETQIYCC